MTKQINMKNLNYYFKILYSYYEIEFICDFIAPLT